MRERTICSRYKASKLRSCRVLLPSRFASHLPPGGRLGCGSFVHLSNFSLKQTDKPEFERLVRVQMGGPSRTPVPTIHQYRPTDKPEFIPLPFSKFFESARGHSKSLNSFVTLSALTSRFTRSPIFSLTFSKKFFASPPAASFSSSAASAEDGENVDKKAQKIDGGGYDRNEVGEGGSAQYLSCGGGLLL